MILRLFSKKNQSKIGGKDVQDLIDKWEKLQNLPISAFSMLKFKITSTLEHVQTKSLVNLFTQILKNQKITSTLCFKKRISQSQNKIKF